MNRKKELKQEDIVKKPKKKTGNQKLSVIVNKILNAKGGDDCLMSDEENSGNEATGIVVGNRGEGESVDISK